MSGAQMVRQALTNPPLVVLRPGDRVLLCLAGEVEQDTSNEIAFALRAAFPGADFTVVTGVASVVVSSGRG